MILLSKYETLIDIACPPVLYYNCTSSGRALVEASTRQVALDYANKAAVSSVGGDILYQAGLNYTPTSPRPSWVRSVDRSVPLYCSYKLLVQTVYYLKA